MTAANIVMQRAPFAQRHTHEAALGGVRRLADRFGHFARLAMAEADPALLVADHHQGGEAEAPAALYHFGDAIDMNETVDEFAVPFFPIAIAAAAAFTFTRHVSLPSLEARSALAPPLAEVSL
jgi:hypothetical protein